jgi:hypothetical protein
MTMNSTVVPLRQPETVDDPLTGGLRARSPACYRRHRSEGPGTPGPLRLAWPSFKTRPMVAKREAFSVRVPAVRSAGRQLSRCAGLGRGCPARC